MEKITKFKKNSVCVRCGADKKEVNKFNFSCETWGTSYGKHLWNKKEFSAVVNIISSNPF